MWRQATKEECRNIAEVCENDARKAKAKLDSKLGRDINGNEMLLLDYQEKNAQVKYSAVAERGR